MSYDIRIKNKKTGEIVSLKKKNTHTGGTFAIGGTEFAEFNITYNYSRTLYKLFGEKGIRFLSDEKVAPTLPKIMRAIESLGDAKPSDDYWEETDGNVKKALEALYDIGCRAVADNPKIVCEWICD